MEQMQTLTLAAPAESPIPVMPAKAGIQFQKIIFLDSSSCVVRLALSRSKGRNDARTIAKYCLSLGRARVLHNIPLWPDGAGIFLHTAGLAFQRQQMIPAFPQ